MWILDLLPSSKFLKKSKYETFQIAPPPLSLDVATYRPQPTLPSLIQSFQPGRKPHFPIRPIPVIPSFRREHTMQCLSYQISFLLRDRFH